MLFGGSGENQFFDDVWTYDLHTNVWSKMHTIGDAPSARSRHCSLIWKGFLVVYGGSDAKAFDPCLYLLDLNIKRWHKIAAGRETFVPQARRDHGAAVIKDSFYVFGGKVSPTQYADAALLRFNLALVNPKVGDNRGKKKGGGGRGEISHIF